VNNLSAISWQVQQVTKS